VSFRKNRIDYDYDDDDEQDPKKMASDE